MGLFADGAAVRTTGTETFRVSREYVDDMMTVTTDEICQVCGKVEKKTSQNETKTPQLRDSKSSSK